MPWRKAILAALVVLAIVLVAVLIAVCRPGPTPTPTPTVTPTLTPSPMPTATATPTPFPTPATFTFAVCGDNRNGDDIYSQLLSLVMADQAVPPAPGGTGSAFLINTGDLVPYGLASYYENFRQLMAPFQKPFYPAPGNHDLYAGSLDNFLKYSGAPAVHYTFDYGSVHFTIVNSALGELNAPELAWLEADLAATRQPVKMVFLHCPPFDPHGGSHILTRGAEELMALAVKYQVRYVIAGHIHGYAREVRDGVTYMITGGAGAPLYYPPDDGGFYHYVRLTVNGTQVAEEVVKIAQD